ncbi:MAG: DNA polymerase I [Christensenellales bacterium]|jgi:DNA polymerase-1
MAGRTILIDGNSLLFRAFYAMPELTAPDGTPVGAVYGFLNMLFKAIDDYAPTCAAVAFDLEAPTFRHVGYDAYKAGRKPTPEALLPQFPLLKEILRAMEVPVVEVEGYEADDILGTLSLRVAQEGGEAIVITGDRDALQLIGPSVRVVITRKGISQTQEYDEALLMDEYGLRPDQIPDLKGLMGDSSDNLPGIPGIGEKTALKLLHAYGSVEGVLSHTHELKGKQREKVEAGVELARMSRQMATICRDVPITLDSADCALKTPGQTGLIAVLERLSFGSLLKRVRAMGGAAREAVQVCELADAPAVSSAVAALAGREMVAVWLGDALCLSDGEQEYRIPLEDGLLGAGLSTGTALSALAPLFGSDTIKVVWDAKEWMHRLAAFQIKPRRMTADVMVAGWLLDGGESAGSAAALAERHTGRAFEPPASALLSLWRTLRAKLDEQGMAALYDTIEQPLTGVLYDMEREGFPVDAGVLRTLGEGFNEQLSSLTDRIYALAGGPFNINSTRQLGEVLFEKLSLPVIKKKKTGWSTDIEVLEALSDRHPIIPLLIEYRQLTKLKGTYIDGLLPLIRQDTGRIHTRFVQTGTATGRLSSAEPNLQNIPVRMPEGRLIRRAFVAGGPGRVLVDADYSQIELRVLAHMADDPGLIDAFRRGEDIHRRTASQVFGVPMEDVTDAMRSSAKAVNFGIVYGISDYGLSRQLGIPRSEAARYIGRYLSTFAGVRQFMEETLALGRERGYVETMFGRRRAAPGLRSGNYNVRSAAERMAMNAPIQGTAADIIKLAMIAVHRALAERKLRARLILQVHDELIVDAPAEELAEVTQLVRDAMERVAELRVPLVVEVGSAYNWYDAI